jgi:hypothetical protein
MIDEKTHEYTRCGLVIAMIAGAQVSEMNCNKKGQIDLAIATARVSTPTRPATRAAPPTCQRRRQ